MKTTLSILVILLIGVAIVFFAFKSRLPDMLANNLSKKLGVKVSINSMGISPSAVTVKGIEMGNPPKTTLTKAFSCEKLEVDAFFTHYLSNEIVIDEISLDKVYLGLEFKN